MSAVPAAIATRKPATCQACGTRLPKPKRTGRPRRWCSESCRREAATVAQRLTEARWRLKAAQREVERLTAIKERVERSQRETPLW